MLCVLFWSWRANQLEHRSAWSCCSARQGGRDHRVSHGGRTGIRASQMRTRPAGGQVKRCCKGKPFTPAFCAPELRQGSLELRQGSLELRQGSLELRQGSLELRRRSPELRRRSPKLRRRSPELRQRSLERGQCFHGAPAPPVRA